MQPIRTGRVKVERLTIAIADLPQPLHDLKLVQLSDLHYDGESTSDAILRQAIDLTHQLDPDLILITGDFVTDDLAPLPALAQHLKSLRASLGIYGVLGNHDLYRRNGRTAIAQVMGEIGIQILWNQVAYPAAGLALVGLADYWAPDYKQIDAVLDTLPAAQPRIVLAHNPDCAESLQRWRVDLQLSGHSHGGQIILPLVGNLSQRAAQVYPYIPRRWRRKIPGLTACFRVLQHWEWVKGFHQVGQNRLYVNRGLGSYFPGRLLCPPEVTLITLKRLR
jgi:hypothetical protein